MTRFKLFFATSLLALPLMVPAQPLASVTDLPGDAGELHLAIKKLNVLGRVLHVAAHPDDENTRLLSYWANGARYETAYLSLTRGDGGQNLIGQELREQLGVIRTQELLAARRLDRGKQFFTRAIDFGYSKTPEETLRIWDAEAVLADTVWVIRRFRPDVIVTRFSPEGGGTHGHHTASAQLAVEAFAAAGDPTRFPEQLEWVEPWSPTRVVWNTGRWFAERQGEDWDDSGLARTEVGGYEPLLGKSFGEIAAASRSMHKSQGFGSGASRGAATEYFSLLAGAPMRAELFDGIDTTWGRVPGAAAWANRIAEIDAAFRGDEPSAVLPALLELRDAMAAPLRDAMAAHAPDPWVEVKQAELDAVILAALGLYADARVGSATAVPGDSVDIDFSIIRRNGMPVELISLETNLDGAVRPVGEALPENVGLRQSLVMQVPAGAPTSEPYWLREAPGQGMFSVSDPTAIGAAENPPAAFVRAVLQVGSATLAVAVPVERITVDRVRGELRQALQIAPPVVLGVGSPVYLFSDAAAREVRVSARSLSGAIRGELRLRVPAGWSVSPAAQVLEVGGQGTEAVFTVRPPDRNATGLLAAEFESAADGRVYHQDLVEIAYEHLPAQMLLPAATAQLARVNLQRGAERIGYLPGAGDSLPENLREVGFTVEMLDPAHPEVELGVFDAVVLGIRAYNTIGNIEAWMSELFRYAEAGGTVVVQYNTSRGLEEGSLVPFPLRLSRDRVTEEQAPITLLAPEHPALRFPNRITAADFDGWVQERGLYFPDQWDAAYTPLLSSFDTGERPLEGGLLVARLGEGWFVYTGYSFFRQLPAGVPGAYRLFVNLLSLSHAGN